MLLDYIQPPYEQKIWKLFLIDLIPARDREQARNFSEKTFGRNELPRSNQWSIFKSVERPKGPGI